MSNDPVIGGLPPRSVLETLTDHKFVLHLTSLGLWIDIVLALTLHKNLLQVDLVWAKGIPIGLSMIVLVGYGLCLTLVLPHLTIFLNRIWRGSEDLINKLRSKNSRDSRWRPDSKRDVQAFDLEIEAVHSGNAALARYAREHIDSVIAEFQRREHFILIGVLLLLEVVAIDSTMNQLTNGITYGLQKAVSVFVLVTGLVSLFEGARAESLWVFYLHRPDQKTH
ncbi:MAG: hypothetical protein FD174_4261 [Geobacteraceae bacterium]|nr:MAG: hypothetical protein FD174_4261 [Geobacteraceae bacterium]